MVIRKFLRFTLPLFVVASLVLGSINQARAQTTPPPNGSGMGMGGPGQNLANQGMPPMSQMKRTTPDDRVAAAQRAKAAREAYARAGIKATEAITPTPGGTPDYFGIYPNWANSQFPELDGTGKVISGTGIRKFVDSLPGLTPAGVNNLGQYIPVATADTTTYAGSDYYEIGLVQYTEKMHSDLPPTLLRGYVQLETAVISATAHSKHIALQNVMLDGTRVPVLDTQGRQVYAVDIPHYLGPTLVAQKDKPTRIKFTNYLPTGSGGNLFIPTDTTDMGSGDGPRQIGVDAQGNPTYEQFKQNRAALHLHGGVTPWISDGTPHQWTTPAGENTSYPQGVSVSNVPDMPDPGPGSLTFFYSNQQSARLMFYHDHAYGITRLNVYAGEAAAYLVQDPVEQALVVSGTLPADQIPLVIQDRTFVPKPAQLAEEDPTWITATWGGQGNLWFPHVYMPNQNPWDTSGANAMGRWDYGPWFWPPFSLVHGVLPNPYAAQPGEPPVIPGTPNPSLVPEGFMDTPVVNGTVYPYLPVEPKSYRLRILNAANDRFWNLSLYQAASDNPMWNADGTLNDANAGEVPMVPASPNPDIPFPVDWTTASDGVGIRPDILDGRSMGVPHPLNLGPSWLQIGTEGGFLPAPVPLDPKPTGYQYNLRNIVVNNVTKHSLYLGPAERADVVVDFSQYAGKTLILYNDAPAPVPAGDPRNDYYTGSIDHSLNGDGTGGAPSTRPGYGPNTRTIMQIRVAPVHPVGNAVGSVAVTNGGAGYTTPTVSFTGGGGTGAAAIATGAVDSITLGSGGANYSSAPAVAIVGLGAGATATATISVAGILLTNVGTGYTAPVVTITDAGGTPTITATTAVVTDTVTGALTVTLTSVGAGYTAPVVKITDVGGTPTVTATATTTGTVDSLTLGAPGAGYATPVVAFTGGGATTPATATATIKVTAVTVTSGGSGYTSAPSVTITDTLPGAGAGALAAASLTAGYDSISSINVTNGGADYTLMPTVQITGGGGTGAAATALGGVEAIALVNAGAGYTSAPTVTLAGGGAVTNATAIAIVKNGVVTGITVVSAGAGYTSTPTVALSGGGATTDATANAYLKVTAITVVISGTGYTYVPEVNLLGGGGYGATAHANLALGTPFNAARVVDAFATTATHKGAFAAIQDPIIVPQAAYNSAYSATYSTNNLVRIADNFMTFQPAGSTVSLTLPLGPKAIQELFEVEYGRMNATLGVEIPNTNALVQTTIPFGYIDPATEIITESLTAMSPVAGDGTQIWKITHNGVDTHAIHFHLFNVQLINRVGWDGAIREPEPEELGWKETLKMSPLEDAIVAMRPIAPKLPFGVPESVRPLDPTRQLGSTMGFWGQDPNGNPVTVINQIVSFGWEYVWHCHLLGHEENDMMRPMVFNVATTLPGSPDPITATTTGSTNLAPQVNLTWTDATPAIPANLGNPRNEIGFRIERAVGNGAFIAIANALANQTRYTDTSVGSGTTYRYRIIAYNASGSSTSATRQIATPAGLKPAAPTGLAATVQYGPQRVQLNWTRTTVNVSNYLLSRTGGGAIFNPVTLANSANSYTDGSVALGITYNYNLVARNTTVNPVLSSAPATVAVLVPVPAPTNLRSTNTTISSITLRWNGITATPPAGYEIWVSLNGTVWTPAGTVGAGVTTFTHTGLATLTQYWYQVRAMVGTPPVYSPWSNTVNARTR